MGEEEARQLSLPRVLALLSRPRLLRRLLGPVLLLNTDNVVALGEWLQKKKVLFNVGISWTGGTVCVAPYTCTELNDYVRMIPMLVSDADKFFNSTVSVCKIAS